MGRDNQTDESTPHLHPPGRAVGEQLSELTRLVLRLPEVEDLLQKAALHPASSRLEPTAALEMFVKVTAELLSPL